MLINDRIVVMKIKKLFILNFVFIILLISCASNSFKNSKEESVSENLVQEVIIEKTPEEILKENLEGISVEFVSSPAEIKKNGTFSEPYVVIVIDSENNPVTNYSIILEYPSGKNGSELIFSKNILKTDENGTASFLPETTDFATNTIVKALPFPANTPLDEENDNTIYNILLEHSVSAPFLIKSDVASKGAVLFIYEYTENNKPGDNSYQMISQLRKQGVSLVGNAPICEVSMINESKENIYKQNYEYIGSDFGYLIGGTIKFTKYVELVGDSYETNLVADIYGIRMVDGTVVFEETFNETATGSNWNKSVSECKNKIIEKIVNSLIYGL